MGEPINTAVCNTFVVIETLTETDIQPQTGCGYGTVRKVGIGVTQVDAYQIVLYRNANQMAYRQQTTNTSFIVVDQTDIILITPYEAPP